MSLKILIAPDKFKATLTAKQAAEAIAEGWTRARPADQIELLPFSDGGDGFGEVLSALWKARKRTVHTVDAAHRPLAAHWWWAPRRKAAIIESARVIGLAQLPPKQFHPFDLDTFGLGAVIEAAAKQGAHTCFIGIGGSATNDAGFGVARALGWQFLDGEGREIQKWTGLEHLQRIAAPKRRNFFRELTVAVDVQNPLLGKRGATRIYGPQKGLRPNDFLRAERCLRRLAVVVKADMGLNMQDMPGAGAAGGLGFGLAAFLGAHLEPGFDLFANEADLDCKLQAADLVVTGEGRLDESSMMGKGIGEIAKRCKRLNRSCIGMAGEVVPARGLKVFPETAALTELTTLEAAKRQPALWLGRTAQNVAKRLSLNSKDAPLRSGE